MLRVRNSSVQLIPISFAAEQLLRKKENGIGETNSLSKSRANLTVTSSVNSTEFTSKFCVLKSITNLHPDRRINTDTLRIPSQVQLADFCFHNMQRIDLVIDTGQIGHKFFFRRLLLVELLIKILSIKGLFQHI